ncbi:leucine-rich repeat domain-containing protein [Aspergillus ibericus CBS 121593]|uniref:Leucine rich repeat domain protein n=1 Tax=Aspergillus ibericus CBS 121593 TaxID=1448316 RepID=A0A395H073_9EURO|nr:leucine rich repeat domain protein [Aspergillus ibericus CBS 121593]RAL00705.1 leucine rich repeat domain protein [Aspergillus ibericus CBS 121593]
MDHEIPLPPPPRIRHRASPTRHPSAPRNHHRYFDDRSSQPPSSDPALFSSDDIPASGLENYHAPGPAGSRKRRYRGTWWGEMVKDKDAKRKRADFKDKRLVDSGVWMGSDDSGFLLSDAELGEELLKENASASASANANANDNAPGAQTQMQIQPQQPQRGVGVFRRTVEEEPREQQIARTIVNDCLERGEDSVDLSGYNLRSIPPNLLLPLQHLTKLPSIKEPPISEDVYTSLQPFLRLFLAGNALPTIPGELFTLDALRVLSLRYNKLTDIPPAIRKLTLLQEVNLSVNRLQTLPWELLWLIRKGDLKHLIVRPNPLLQIEEQEITTWHVSPENLNSCTYDTPPPEESWAPIHVATGPVTRYNAEGVPLDPQPTSFSPSSSSSSPTPKQETTRVPSLRELSLLSFSRSPYPDLLSSEEIDTFPALMGRLLRTAKEVRSAGGRSCSVCHRAFVMARMEWIEWWDCSTYENGLKGPRGSGERLRPLPFRRVGCSWGCGPEATV